MRFLVGFVAAIALVITGCGSDTERASSNTDATALLRSTFTNLQNLKSAAVGLKATSGGQAGTATGAFERGDATKFTLSGTAAGRTAGATWTGERGFVTLDGTSYEIPALFAQQARAAVPSVLPDITKWVNSPVNAGTASVGGVPTIKITGTANALQIRADLQRFMGPLQMFGRMPTPTIKQAAVEVYTGASDSQLRRLVVRGKDGVVELTLTKVGQPQKITAPANARPFAELQGK